MTEKVELLSAPGNYCIVQVSGRRFPGIVFQGDSTDNLLHKLNIVEARLQELGIDYGDDARAELDSVRDTLDKVLQQYENVIESVNGELPYPERAPLNIAL